MSILIKNIHCIKALINRNPEKVVLLKADSKKNSEIIALAESKNIPVDLTMNGVSAICKEPPIKDIKSQGYELGNIVLIMDEIQDTRNLGSCLRSASFFGVDSVIIPKNKIINPIIIITKNSLIIEENSKPKTVFGLKSQKKIKHVKNINGANIILNSVLISSLPIIFLLLMKKKQIHKKEVL